MCSLHYFITLFKFIATSRPSQNYTDYLFSCQLTIPLRIVPPQDLAREEAERLAAEACYLVQQAANQLWPSVRGRTKDYIAKAKPNGYQSLHTTLRLPPLESEGQLANGASWQMASPGDYGGGGSAASVSDSYDEQDPAATPLYLELQIRTAGMDQRAESGDAAHTAYKGGLDSQQARQLQTWTQELQRRLSPPAPQLQLPQPAATATSSTPGEAAAAAAAAAAAQDAESAAEQLFHHMDKNGDGHLSLEELQALLQELGVQRSDTDAAALMSLLDTNADAGVSLQVRRFIFLIPNTTFYCDCCPRDPAGLRLHQLHTAAAGMAGVYTPEPLYNVLDELKLWFQCFTIELCTINLVALCSRVAGVP